ncbi:TolC family protein [Sessilibacter corallicola]|uniref:TolC family protein n=1 Tax=Sessilibacter corallicola TaxID=2904075 RepID=UPI001E368450|nr:TolC family protein [Sessilibacter corallicola]MCE2029832.1 TolC family protein [Sessilibacter corallicola]
MGLITSYGRGVPCWLLFVVLMSVFSSISNANTPKPLTLNQAIALTLDRNPQLYRYQFIDESLQARRQTSQLRPAIELGVEIENFAGSGDSSEFSGAETTVSLSSVIELGNKSAFRSSVIDAKIARNQLQQQVITLDVLGELTKLYIEGLATQEYQSLAKETLTLSQQLLTTVNTRSEQGATSQAEVLRAQALVTQNQLKLSALNRRLERINHRLAGFWGDSNPVFSRLDGSLFAFGDTVNFENLYDRVQQSPTIQRFASDARIKEAEISLARVNNKTDLSWRAGIRHFAENDDAAFVAEFSVPLFTRQRNQGDLNSAISQRNAVEYAQRDALLNLRSQLYDAWSLRKQNIEAVHKTQTEIIPALEKALRLTRNAYENGRFRYLDLVSQQEELLAVKQLLIDSASSALTHQAIIEQLTNEAVID